MIVETAYAKLNLALHVRRRRSDGYHDLETVFAFCEDGDRLEVERADANSLTIDGPFAEGLSSTDNLVLRAADAMGVTARFHLTKNLPVASGIGGGSADAAAALLALSKLYAVPIPNLDMQRALGADVPACVQSITMRGEGVGDGLTSAASVAGTPVLLVNPRVPLATAAVFKAWDGVDRGPLIDWRLGRNDLEVPARLLVPEIGEVLERLANQVGVSTVRMSGSGATCFALFDDIAQRDAALARGGDERPDWWMMASRLR